MKAEEVLDEILREPFRTSSCLLEEYASYTPARMAILFAGAIAGQLGNINCYRVRKRQLGFEVNGRTYKLRFRHGFGVEVVEYKGLRDVKIRRTIRSLADTHGILAAL